MSEQPQLPAASRGRRLGASLIDALLLLGTWLTMPAFFTSPDTRAWGMAGGPAVTAVGGAALVGVLLVLGLQSFVLTAHRRTFGMGLAGTRLVGGWAPLRAIAPTLSFFIAVGSLRVAYLGTMGFFDWCEESSAYGTARFDMANSLKIDLQQMTSDQKVAWTPFLLIVPSALIVLASGRALVDWLAGGRPVREPAPSPSAGGNARRWGPMDYVLLLAVALPGALASGLSAWGGDHGAVLADALSSAIAAALVLSAQGYSSTARGATLAKSARAKVGVARTEGAAVGSPHDPKSDG